MGQEVRLGGYVRVSSVSGRAGETFQSPGQQRDALTRYCAAHGHELAVVVEELDVSGSRAAEDRELETLIRRVEDGDLDGIVVARLDRFSRSLVGGLAAIDRIERAGGTFVSVQDGFDLSTPTGKLVLRIMLSLAEFELARIRASFQTSKANAVRRGVFVATQVPFGYQRGPDGRLVPDEREAPWVRRIFELRATGTGWATISRTLQDAGVVTRAGSAVWANQALRRLTQSRTYLGEVSVDVDGERVSTPDAHEAIVDRELFERCATVRGIAFTPRAGDRQGTPSPLKGLVRCAGCRCVMRWELRAFATGEEWLLSCRNASSSGDSATRCPQPVYARDVPRLEDIVVDKLIRQRIEVSTDRPAGSIELDALEATAARARVVRNEWRDDPRVQEQLGMDDYLAGMAVRDDAVLRADAAIATARARLGGRHGVQADLHQRWPMWDVNARALALQSVLTCVMLRRPEHGSSRLPTHDSVHLIWRGDDVDLPSRGRRRTQALVPFEW